ncbi:BglG family transcription antiterminator [Propionicicella superfundia]|uniref:BglG family transcription antiterminator n=1 Tax=Propionicicella superfundia TaxID=348582 RepID=UPI0004179C4C|nr:HTH domain-containing protein [Propionicicella superfundia]
MNRQAAILNQLETSLSVSPATLADRFGVSEKTVAAEVAQLNVALGAAGSVRLHRGRYRLLVVDTDGLRAARERIVGIDAGLGDPQRRTAFILARLMRSERPVRIEELVAEMFVGRTTVVADLARLREGLSGLDVRIEGRTHVGLRLDGPELGIRLAVLRYAWDAAYADYPLGPELTAALTSAVAEGGLPQDVAATVHRWATVILDRYLGGHPLVTLPVEYQSLANTRAHDLARRVAARLEPLIAETLPPAEVLFLAIPAAGRRTPTVAEDREGSPEAVPDLVEDICRQIRDTMDVEVDAGGLLAEFSHHLAFMINRMRYSQHVTEPIQVEQIRAQYPLAHHMATIARGVIAERTGLAMDDTEVALTATYFQVYLEDHAARPQPPFRVAIVTPRGPGVARLIQTRMAKVLPPGTTFQMFSTDTDERVHDADLVVATPGTTVDVPAPVLQLSEVFDSSELARRLAAMRFPGYRQLALPRHAGSILVTLLDADRFVPLPRDCAYLDGTRLLIDHLVERGLMDEAFRSAVAEREKRATMLLDEVLAFPHAVAPHGEHLVCALGLIPRGDAEEGLRAIFLMAAPEKALYDDTILIRAYDDLIRLGSNRLLLSKVSRLSTYEQFFYLMESAAEDHVL